MEIELTPDAARWVEAEVASGTYPSPEEAVRQAVDQLRLSALRAKIDAAIAGGGRNTSEEALHFVQKYLDSGGRSVDDG
ncbi:ribbon-helix-helix domain-containing protein [Lichenibacterium dinghuense]|uniref:ribbon-helix-helix domain-containing protein n=1 Tax=Lichenibacterium dinghuense TaxID=2895977 RepID=UPI001F4785E3|nr:hypothetical protein [Lichenibacterium sp. 6Y81]